MFSFSQNKDNITQEDIKNTKLSPLEEKKLVNESRDESRHTAAGMAIGGGLSYAAGKVLAKSMNGRMADKLSKGFRLSALIQRKGGNKHTRRYEDNMLKDMSAISGLEMGGSVMKGLGKGLAFTGAGYGGLQELSRLADPGDQGVVNDEVIKGNKTGLLLGGGLLASAVGFGGKAYLGKKVTNTVMKKSPTQILKEELKYNRETQKIYDSSNGNWEDTRERLSKIKKPQNDPYEVLTPEVIKIKSLTRDLETLNLGDIDKHMKIEDEIAKLTKKLHGDSGITGNTIRAQAMFAGIGTTGGLATGAGALNSSDYGAFKSKELKAKEDKLRKRNQTGLTKVSMDPLTAGLAGHMVQNGLFNYFTKTKSGKDSAGKFITDRFTEGYTGKAVKDGFSDKLTRLEAKINPLNLFRSKKEAVSAARKGGNRLSAYRTGTAYQLMPEAEVLAKEIRASGAALRNSGIDIHDTLTPKDLKAFGSIADGDLHGGVSHLSTSPTAAKIFKTMFPSRSDMEVNSLGSMVNRAIGSADPKLAGTGVGSTNIKGVKSKAGDVEKSRHRAGKINQEWQDTNVQDILRATKDNIVKQKGLSGTSREALGERVKNETKGYNASHVALGATEWVAAGFNGLKRVATMDKIPLKEGEHGLLSAGKKIVNGAKTATDVGFVKFPSLQAKVRGLSGTEYKQGVMGTLSQVFGSPALKAQMEDTQRISRLGHTLSSDSAKGVMKDGKMVGENAFHQKVLDAGAEAKAAADRYGSGLKGMYNMSMDVTKAVNKVSDGEGKNVAKGVLKSLSKNEETKELGRKELGEAGKRLADKGVEAAKKQTVKMEQFKNKIQDEAFEVENRYRKWALPGTAIATAGLSSPMIKDIYDRNMAERQKRVA